MLYFRAASTEDGHTKAGHGNFEFMIQRARVPEQALPVMVRRKGTGSFAPIAENTKTEKLEIA